MADHIITGKLYLNFPGDAEAIAEYTARTASENGICVRIDGRIAQEHILHFAVSDSPESRECDRLFSGILYRDGDFSIADVSGSGLPGLERLLQSIIIMPCVQMIEIDIDHAHGSPIRKYVCVICAKDFCKTIADTPNHGHAMPTVRMRIVRPNDIVAAKTECQPSRRHYTSYLRSNDIAALQLLSGGVPFCLRASAVEVQSNGIQNSYRVCRIRCIRYYPYE